MEIEEEYIEKLNKIDPDKYEIEEIKERTKKDIEILENIYNKLSGISEEKDSKITATH